MIKNLHPLQQINFIDSNQAYVIEASAGTGKTWTIERLYIKALLEAVHPNHHEQRLSVENLLVVTFTNDATNELKQRISTQIQITINYIVYFHRQMLEGTKFEPTDDIFLNYLYERLKVLKADAKKDLTSLTHALQHFDQASIFTIHGFCKRILQDYQFECQTPANFELVANKTQVINALVRDFMRIHIINNAEHENKISTVLKNLEQLFQADSSQSNLIEQISSKLPQDLFNIKAREYVVKYKLPVEASLLALSLDEIKSENILEVKAEFIAAVIAYIQANYAKAVAPLNTISYNELIQKVADNVQFVEGLADKVFNKYPLAFIDEFQDTDSLQWQIFSTIYHLTQQKRGYVIVVGDPKQAIYRFRGADVDTYLEAREQIGERLELTKNYRSQPNIMNFINQLFDLKNQLPRLANGAVDLENSFLGKYIDYSKISACGSNTLRLPSANELNKLTAELGVELAFYDEEVQIVTIKGASVGERNDKLLTDMTVEILALLKADPKLKGKIAILVTKNSDASKIVAFLRKFGVKAAELKLGNIFTTTAAQDFYLILQAINDLSDRKLLLQALMSRLFNLSLTKLAPETKQQISTLEFWQQKFFNYQEIWGRYGVFSVVYALLLDIVEHHQQEADILSNRELANLWQLAELINNQANRLHNNHELLYWFKNKIKDAGLSSPDLDGQSDELIRLDNDDEQIIITTQHKAKGLEYEILFCPYFKTGVQLDGQFDANYRRPFFSTFRDGGQEYAELVIDAVKAQQIVVNDNTEAHRLNYVALTRAKSRIYIYLKQPTLTKFGKYNTKSRPDKLGELFGYKANNPVDNEHQLFNYPRFFGEFPDLALKRVDNPEAFTGVVAYQRPVLDEVQLKKLEFVNQAADYPQIKFEVSNNQLNLNVVFTRQSYSSLISQRGTEALGADLFVRNELIPETSLLYRYSVLQDSGLKGAEFGTLFHELCENYPFSQMQLKHLLNKSNLAYENNDYLLQFTDMLNEAFNYPLLDGSGINDFPAKQHELDFNLTIGNKVSFREQLAELLSEYFGLNHPFTQACKQLEVINTGYLIGFIDLFFEHQGKYWVLDYKTNRLNNYQAPADCLVFENPLIASMADHHYYLQYLLYLVAIKRYLEQTLDIPDGSQLIGGSIYYYVRGIYTQNCQPGDGVYLDRGCQELVKKIDLLLRGLDDVKS